MNKFALSLLGSLVVLGSVCPAFASEYECKASYSTSAVAAPLAIELKKVESSSGLLTIGGKAENTAVAIEVDEEAGLVKLILRGNGQTVQTIGGFSQIPSSKTQVFQAALTQDTNAIAGAGVNVTIECTKSSS